MQCFGPPLGVLAQNVLVASAYGEGQRGALVKGAGCIRSGMLPVGVRTLVRAAGGVRMRVRGWGVWLVRWGMQPIRIPE